MSDHQQYPLEELLPAITSDQNPFESESKPSAGPAVLEAVEDDSVLAQTPVSVLCPGCGEVITRYRYGLPERLAHFDEECHTCETGLRRWCSVGIATALEASPTLEQLQSTTTRYWERHLWEGIMTGESYPRTEEYARAYRDQARQFGWEWELTCPLCRRGVSAFSIDRFDYHHWYRDPDQGICLCRACHTGITGNGRDEAQDWRAQQVGLKNKHDLQLTRLAVREQVVGDHETLTELVDTVVSRYNPTVSRPELFALLSQSLTAPETLTAIQDEYLLAELPRH